VATGVEIPAGFDVHEFLEGARTLYVRLQQAWASRKVDDLAPFVSARMLGLLQKQAAANPDPVPVEILLVNATLNKVAREEQTEKAEVAFSVVMRTGQEEEPAEVNETWLFMRGGDSGGMWRLTGIRQS
jgi:predicted lipid-binding transport protein (Tim44 family)